ncbi:hypothetical protein T484DRAFT_1766795 [Baffinella frigidus]|nr:hypothetical protein T484DRAFT_1766795 [Cryptophyta sp. CCMP2293]
MGSAAGASSGNNNNNTNTNTNNNNFTALPRITSHPPPQSLPLHWASMGGQAAAAELLIVAGWDVNGRDRQVPGPV